MLSGALCQIRVQAVRAQSGCRCYVLGSRPTLSSRNWWAMRKRLGFGTVLLAVWIVAFGGLFLFNDSTPAVTWLAFLFGGPAVYGLVRIGRSAQRGEARGRARGTETKRYHLKENPLPQGHQIYAKRLEPTGLGIEDRKESAVRFARGSHQRLRLEHEPENQVDPNAVRVIGIWRESGEEHHARLGYVPHQLAGAIAELDILGEVSPRLAKTYVSSGGYVEIMFQITGPKARVEEWRGQSGT